MLHNYLTKTTKMDRFSSLGVVLILQRNNNEKQIFGAAKRSRFLVVSERSKIISLLIVNPWIFTLENLEG
jgi:hypothetical protein